MQLLQLLQQLQLLHLVGWLVDWLVGWLVDEVKNGAKWLKNTISVVSQDYEGVLFYPSVRPSSPLSIHQSIHPSVHWFEIRFFWQIYKCFLLYKVQEIQVFACKLTN